MSKRYSTFSVAEGFRQFRFSKYEFPMANLRVVDKYTYREFIPDFQYMRDGDKIVEYVKEKAKREVGIALMDYLEKNPYQLLIPIVIYNERNKRETESEPEEYWMIEGKVIEYEILLVLLEQGDKYVIYK